MPHGNHVRGRRLTDDRRGDQPVGQPDAVLARHKGFNVNLLAPRHAELVEVFGGRVKGRQRFATGDWLTSTHGLPLLSDVVALLECRVVSQMEVATDTLFIGEVETIVNHPQINSLLWVNGCCSSPRSLA